MLRIAIIKKTKTQLTKKICKHTMKCSCKKSAASTVQCTQDSTRLWKSNFVSSCIERVSLNNCTSTHAIACSLFTHCSFSYQSAYGGENNFLQQKSAKVSEHKCQTTSWYMKNWRITETLKKWQNMLCELNKYNHKADKNKNKWGGNRLQFYMCFPHKMPPNPEHFRMKASKKSSTMWRVHV